MFEKYSEYKESGVEWIGKVPAHWQVRRIKNLCNINQDSLREDASRDFAFEYVDIGNVSFEKGVLQTESVVFKNAPSRARRIARSGDTIVSTVRTYLKAIDYIDNFKSHFIYSTGFAILNPKNVSPRFLTMAIRSNSFTNQVDVFSTGMSYPAINSTELGRLRIAVPTLPEQTAIANFLDRKTAQIDKAISIKEKQIELFKERRQILIHNAVTCGLDPDVKMKDSGVEWIGDIPEGWEVSANRVLFTERNQPGREGLPLLSVSIHTAISSEELDEESNIRGKVKIEDKSSYKLVEVNDIVFNMMRAWQGAIGAVRTNGMVSPAYVVAKPNKKVEANYAEYQYRTSAYIQEMNRVSKGITDFRKRLYWHEFKQLMTILPPFEEQEEIVSYIENISGKITNAMSLKQQEIEKLKEYKSTLINSAVTGKIKVT